MDILTGLLVLVILLAAFLRLPLFLVLGSVSLVLKLAGMLESGQGLATLFEFFGTPDNNLSETGLLVPIPFFCLTGYLLSQSGLPLRLIHLVKAFIGGLPGSLAIVTILACAALTPFTGASGITIIALGGLLFPILLREKYSESFSMGVITGSGSIGLLFFPSLPILLYAVIAGNALTNMEGLPDESYRSVPIAHMYLAGILPGLVLILFPAVYSWWKRRDVPVEPGARAQARQELKKSWGKISLEFGIIPVLFWLLLSNYIDINETAILTLAYYFVLEVLIFKEIGRETLIPVVRQAMVLTGGIILIVIMAQAFTQLMLDLRVEQAIRDVFSFLPPTTGGKIIFLVLLNIILLMVGAIMDVFSAIMVVVPLLLPLAVTEPFGIHPIHFGIIFLTNLEIGYCTPPVGLNLFISSLRFNRPLLSLYKATIPFLLMMLASLIIITYVPAISLALVPEKKIATPGPAVPDGSVPGGVKLEGLEDLEGPANGSSNSDKTPDKKEGDSQLPSTGTTGEPNAEKPASGQGSKPAPDNTKITDDLGGL